MAQGIEEAGASEGRAVIARIGPQGTAEIPTSKGGRLPAGLSDREPLVRRSLSQTLDKARSLNRRRGGAHGHRAIHPEQYRSRRLTAAEA